MIDENLNPAIVEKRNEKLVKYLRQTLCVLPSAVITLDTSKVLLAYFAVSGLDILNKLDQLPHSRESLIDWIYNHQISETICGIDIGICGFRGSTTLVTDKIKNVQNHEYDCSHLTMTFSALNALLTLGDDLSRINKKAILTSIQALQLLDGSLTATSQDYENDVRFLYSACCICYILNDWSFIDIERAYSFLLSCMTYEGAFGQNPEAEAHGGSTFCAVASLFLMNKLNSLSKYQIFRLKQWCLNRQATGFSGRVNKPWDTCYSFWIGSTLKILGVLHFTSFPENINYIFETYNYVTGGFAKWPDCNPDPLHTYMGICGLSLVDYPSFEKIHPAMAISQRAFNHLKNLHQKWSENIY
ncbi:unnamed protein product [Brachionus calyciflorus]|uniref:Geranylgeranyl transferase type-1 subunit beta n=1 Tax=Brachionus calyciflorus TaxID=104777 RepID=A0A813UQN1_9BILA|nr:unnamed protein product [Brachionus calyciflorus]